MSAALQFPNLARAADQRRLHLTRSAAPLLAIAASASPMKPPATNPVSRGDCEAGLVRAGPGPVQDFEPDSHPRLAAGNSLAFYRKQTESLLRRYLYTSMLVGRTPSILTERIVRGWASSRPVKTFENCVIFVLDMEKCLDRLSALERVLLKRIVLQEYTQAETALLLNRSERFIRNRFGEAVDRLTEILLDTGALEIPH